MLVNAKTKYQKLILKEDISNQSAVAKMGRMSSVKLSGTNCFWEIKYKTLLKYASCVDDRTASDTKQAQNKSVLGWLTNRL